MLAGGAHKDLGVSLSGSGVASGLDVGLDCPWGWMGNLGFQRATSRHVGYGFSVRYVNLQYRLGSASIDAWSIGVDLDILLNP